MQAWPKASHENRLARGRLPFVACGSESQAATWYRQAKETKCGGMNGRESQRPDSTGEAGESDPRRPGGGKRDFYDGSYGFRSGRSAHQALQSLWEQTMQTGGGWILEVDIRKFFDTLDHAHLREFLQRRVRDGVLLRLVGKWLNAGDPGNCPLVPSPPPSTDRGAAPDAESETPRPHGVLWDHRQRQCLVAVPVRDGRRLEKVAGPTPPARVMLVGAIRAA